MNKERLQAVFNHGIRKIRKIYPDFATPTLDTDLHGLSAGRAWFDRHHVQINPEIPEEGYRQTVLHELAHLVAWKEHFHTGHGAQWKQVMHMLGMNPERTHRYGLTPARGSRRVCVVCDCKDHWVPPRVYKAIVAEPDSYRCKLCNSSLKEKK